MHRHFVPDGNSKMALSSLILIGKVVIIRKVKRVLWIADIWMRPLNQLLEQSQYKEKGENMKITLTYDGQFVKWNSKGLAFKATSGMPAHQIPGE